MFALSCILVQPSNRHTEDYIKSKFGKKPDYGSNLRVLEAGFHYGDTIEAITPSFHVLSSQPRKGIYRNINGNTAAAWGLIEPRKSRI